MCALAEEAFSAGAVGLSTGLIYVPATYAETDEIVTLARIAARWRRPYATHMRDEGERLGEALDEAIEIGRRSGARVQISHCKAFGSENKGKSRLLLDTLHRARLAGIDVRGDQYPYTASSTFLVTLLPSAASEGGVEELKRRCDDPEALRRQLTPGTWGPTTAADTVIIAHADPSTIGRTVADIAADRSLDPFAAVCALIAEDPGAMVVEHGMHDDDVVAIMADPLIGVGSDNGAPVGIQHPRTWGCFPEFFGRFVRERGVVGWEEGIRKATSATALQFDLAHRGTLQPGSIADICVFDPETIAHPGTYAQPDVAPVGIEHVVLGGTVVVEHGDFTGARAGARAPGRTGLRDGVTSATELRVAMLAPISWRVPPRHYGPWEQFVSLLTEGLVERGIDVTLFAAADSVTSARLVGTIPTGYSEDPDLDPKVWEAPPHRDGVRASRRVRPDPQQLRLPAAHVQRSGRHARPHHDPRVLVGEDRARLRALRRSRPLRRDQRRRPAPEAPLRGHDPPRHPDAGVPARDDAGGLPVVLRADPSAQGDGRGDRRGRAGGPAARRSPASCRTRSTSTGPWSRASTATACGTSVPSGPTSAGRCWAAHAPSCTSSRSRSRSGSA